MRRLTMGGGASIGPMGTLLLLLPCLVSCGHGRAGPPLPPARAHDLDLVERDLGAYTADPAHPDDGFVLVTLREGLAGARERNGGIGACLVRKSTGEVLEVGHNRQYEPYFRSDLHAEMDLLDRYEERMRRTRSSDPRDPSYRDPRDMDGVVLYTSVEPCPMCLTRIINSGLKEVYYAAPDPTGGMASRFDSLPPSWKNMAAGMILEPAACSPPLRDLAARLFRPMYRQGPPSVRPASETGAK
jgi:tRNA(adenine34) deaminase